MFNNDFTQLDHFSCSFLRCLSSDHLYFILKQHCVHIYFFLSWCTTWWRSKRRDWYVICPHVSQTNFLPRCFPMCLWRSWGCLKDLLQPPEKHLNNLWVRCACRWFLRTLKNGNFRLHCWHLNCESRCVYSFCTSPNFALLTFSWFWVGKMHWNCLKVPRSGFGACQIQWEWFQVDNFSSFRDVTHFPVFLLKNETVEFWILAQKLCRTTGT